MSIEYGYVPNELLGRLVGFRLLAVEFILDYVQLRFDRDSDEPQPILMCDAPPHVEWAGSAWRQGDLGYADALRQLVGADVVSTEERTGVGLRIAVGEGVIVLHPEPDEIPGPEIAVLRGFADSAWMCWRPGEESFEDLA